MDLGDQGVPRALGRFIRGSEHLMRLLTLTQADIGEFYDAFTALRERVYRSRLDPASSEESLFRETQHVRDMSKIM